MSYAVKEIFLTLQGEGAHAGRAAVFCRFSGCNLWTGREEDRAGAVCTFCDTDFVGMDGTLGGRYATADDLAETVAAQWTGTGSRYVVLTGGEPLLQVDDALVAALRIRKGHELKLVYPQDENRPEDFAALAFERFSLQPLDGPDIAENTARAIEYCLRHPQWRLSVQTHKTLGIR